MVVLEGTRTDTNLKHAFSEEGRFDRRFLKQELAAEAMGNRGLAALSRTEARNGACFAAGHLDFLVADEAEKDVSAADFAARMTTTINDRTGMYAGMARTARDEGFEEIADWFKLWPKRGARTRAGCTRSFINTRAKPDALVDRRHQNSECRVGTPPAMVRHRLITDTKEARPWLNTTT